MSGYGWGKCRRRRVMDFGGGGDGLGDCLGNGSGIGGQRSDGSDGSGRWCRRVLLLPLAHGLLDRELYDLLDGVGGAGEPSN